MPLDYRPDTPWPPREVAECRPMYREWLAWYRGDVRALRDVYVSSNPNVRVRPSQQAGGVVGALGRFFWGRPVNQSGQVRQHVPAAKDVAGLSAALLFADPPAFVLPNRTPTDGAQQVMDEVLGDGGVHAVLHEGAELSSAAGGVYLRASANVALADGPIVEAILPDQAIPEFYGPWLTSVIFWRVLSDPDGTPVVRHLELHEMVGEGAAARCFVQHAVYVGGPDRLGRQESLEDHPETARLAALVDEFGRVPIGTSRLDVVYVPNIKPHTLIPGSCLGRSDFLGAEAQMDQLDETWSSWMRDIRLGKGRLVVPRSYIRRGPDGEGGYFDPEQEVFTQVNAQLGASESPTLQITAAQFQIRVDEHDRTARELWRIILRNAQMDGNENESENTPAQTATGVNDKASRKRATRAIKMRYWTPQLRRLSFVLQELLQLYWPGRLNGTPMPANIEWPDASAPDAETLARTLQLLDAAGAVSAQTKVEMLHPEWDETQVQDEVERIAGDAPAPPDPADPNAPPASPQGVGEPVDDPELDEDSGAPL